MTTREEIEAACKLVEKLPTNCEPYEDELGALLTVARKYIAERAPCFRAPQLGDEGQYAYVEQLADDSPPTMLRLDESGTWRFWHIAGWMEVTRGVCLCHRPTSKRERERVTR